MRIYIISLIFLGTALAFPGKDLSENEFEEKFHKKYASKEVHGNFLEDHKTYKTHNCSC